MSETTICRLLDARRELLKRERHAANTKPMPSNIAPQAAISTKTIPSHPRITVEFPDPSTVQKRNAVRLDNACEAFRLGMRRDLALRRKLA